MQPITGAHHKLRGDNVARGAAVGLMMHLNDCKFCRPPSRYADSSGLLF